MNKPPFRCHNPRRPTEYELKRRRRDEALRKLSGFLLAFGLAICASALVHIAWTSL